MNQFWFELPNYAAKCPELHESRQSAGKGVERNTQRPNLASTSISLAKIPYDHLWLVVPTVHTLQEIIELMLVSSSV